MPSAGAGPAMGGGGLNLGEGAAGASSGIPGEAGASGAEGGASGAGGEAGAFAEAGQGGEAQAARGRRSRRRLASAWAGQVVVEHVRDQIRENAVGDPQAATQLTRQIEHDQRIGS